MKNIKAQTKYRHLCNVLESAIRSGEFAVGARLPGERDLALRYGMSHMTARRAVGELVENELLERRHGSGVYVRPRSREKLSMLTLNLICAAHSSSMTQSFLHHGSQSSAQRDWRIRVTRLYQGHERPVIRAIREGEPALVFLDKPDLWHSLSAAMQHADGRAVLIGNRMDDKGVPSVMGDDEYAVRLAAKHLKAAGHQRVALITSSREHMVARVQVATWKDAFAEEADDVLERRLIVLEVADFRCRIQSAYDAMRNYLMSEPDVTALISTDDEIALGALAACHDAGRPIPHKMSLLNLGDSALLKMERPAGITALDVRMQQHIETALEMIEAALTKTLPPHNRVRLIKPRLIRRGSVCPPDFPASKKI